MAGLVPAIHALLHELPEDVDARDKRGHDGDNQCIAVPVKCRSTVLK